MKIPKTHVSYKEFVVKIDVTTFYSGNFHKVFQHKLKHLVAKLCDEQFLKHFGKVPKKQIYNQALISLILYPFREKLETNFTSNR